MEKLRVGIIGCGDIARNLHMPAWQQVPEVEMTAFASRDKGRLTHAVQTFGTPGARGYADYRELLESKDVDVVDICTPNFTHARMAIDAMEAGKHVLVEKPMATTYADAKKMLAVSEKTGKILSVNYQNRFRPDCLYLKKVCENGELGEIYYAKAHALRRRAVPTWGLFLNKEAQGGGPLIDIGTHALDLTLWMMDNYSPKMVVGSTYHKLCDQTDTANVFGNWMPSDFEVEDSSFGFIVMQNGATIVLESSWALNILDVGEAKTTLCGTKAGADMRDGLRINGVKNNRFYTECPDFGTVGMNFYQGEKKSPSVLEYCSFIDAVKEGVQPVIQAAQAAVVTRILEAIYDSSSMGKPVFFEE